MIIENYKGGIRLWWVWVVVDDWVKDAKEWLTWEEGRQRVPISRFGRESWNAGCGSTTPWSSTMPHSSQLPSPQLHLTRICISNSLPFFSLLLNRVVGMWRTAFIGGCLLAQNSLAFPAQFRNIILTNNL